MKRTVEVDDSLYQDLQEISRLTGEDPGDLLARALREWLQLREDLEDGQVAAERIAEYNRTGRAVTQDEIREQLSRRPPRRA